MARYSDILTDQNLVPIEGALVSVLTDSGGYAALKYDDGSTLENPFYTPDTGAYYFNATDAVYTIQFRFGGRLVEENNVIVGTPPAFKGDPGGASNIIGLLTDGPFVTVPVGTDIVQVTGIAVIGDEGAGMQLIYDPDVDAAYVALHPTRSFIDAAGRGFREIGKRLIDDGAWNAGSPLIDDGAWG